MFIPDPKSWLWIFSIPNPGSGTGSRIQIRITAGGVGPLVGPMRGDDGKKV